MKILVTGLGSMGKRRIRNLQALGIDAITGYDPRADRREEAAAKYGVATVADWTAAAALPVDAWVISTPPDTHLDYAFQAMERGCSFFTEVGVPDERLPRLVGILDAQKVGPHENSHRRTIGAASCTMRHFPGPKLAKEVLTSGQIGRPLVATYHFGHYLPDWHPWESYKDFYVSKPQTGACREILCFDLIWLVDLLGPVASVTGMRGRIGELDADIDDVCQAVLGFQGGTIGNILIEVTARPPVRRLRLGGTEGTFEWDHTANTARLWTATSGTWETLDLDRGQIETGYIYAEEPYVSEMADFLAAVRGERSWPHDFAEDAAIRDLALAIERASLIQAPHATGDAQA